MRDTSSEDPRMILGDQKVVPKITQLDFNLSSKAPHILMLGQHGAMGYRKLLNAFLCCFQLFEIDSVMNPLIFRLSSIYVHMHITYDHSSSSSLVSDAEQRLLFIQIDP